MAKRFTSTFAAGALSLALVVACPIAALAVESTGGAMIVSGVAGAMLTTDSDATEEVAEETPQLPAALKGETDVEKLTIAFDKAQANLKAVEERVARIQVQIDELEKILPEQQARSDAGIKQRYIMQSNPLAIAEPLLSSQSLDEFIRQIDYLQEVSKANLKEFNKTTAMKNDLDQAKEEQSAVRDQANAEVVQTQAALRAVQDERANKQKEAQAQAVSQSNSEGKKESSKKKNDEKSDKGELDKALEEAREKSSDLLDGADWYAPRDEFISTWAERLDNYLAGTPLAGQGKNFAASAWKYCIDPRWSAAISNTESSKGAHCIRPHNAWGWGAADSDPYGLASEWASWEEAIDAHAKGLAKGYGYTITMRGAQSYCPPTWQSWYNKTLSEMAKI